MENIRNRIKATLLLVDIIKQLEYSIYQPSLSAQAPANKQQIIAKIAQFNREVSQIKIDLDNLVNETTDRRQLTTIKSARTKFINKYKQIKEDLRKMFADNKAKARAQANLPTTNLPTTNLTTPTNNQTTASKTTRSSVPTRQVYQIKVTVRDYNATYRSRSGDKLKTIARNSGRNRKDDLVINQTFATKKEAQEFKQQLTDQNFVNRLIEQNGGSSEYINAEFGNPVYDVSDIIPISTTTPYNLQVNNATSWLFSIDHKGYNRIKDQCLLQFLIDGLANNATTKRSFSNITREQMTEIMSQYRKITPMTEQDLRLEALAEEIHKELPGISKPNHMANTSDIKGYIVQDAINFCEHIGVSLTLVFPNYQQIYHKIANDKHVHLYGMVNNNHISLITNPETKVDIKNGKVQPIRVNYDCAFEYSISTSESVQEVYQMLKEFEAKQDVVEQPVEQQVEQETIVDQPATVVNQPIKQKLFIVTEDIIQQLAIKIFQEEKLEIENLRVSKRDYIGFSYKTAFVECNSDVLAVLDLCQQINERFTNQSLVQLCQIIIERVQALPTSTMNKQVWDVYNNVKPAKLIGIKASNNNAFEVDTTRDYSNILLNTQIKRFFYDETCSFMPIAVTTLDQIKDGHYLVKTIYHPMVDIQTQVVNSDLLKKFYAISAIKLEDIVAYIEPIGCLNPDFWKQFHDIFQQIRDPVLDGNRSSAIKRMINFFIGNLGKMNSTSSRAWITTDHNVLLSMVQENMITSFTMEDSIYTCFNEKTESIYTGNKPLQYDIVLESTYRMMCLEREIIRLNPDAVVLGYNTDAIYFNKPIQNKPDQLFPCFGLWGSYKYNLKSLIENQPREATPYSPDLSSWQPVDIDEASDLPLNFPSSFLMVGAPGTGKSYTLKNKIIPTIEDYVVMAPTHKAACNLIQQGIQCCTLASVLYSVEGESHFKYLDRLLKKFSGKTVIIDEIALCALYDIKVLYSVHLKAIEQNQIINWIFIGDFNQCPNPSTTVDFQNSYILQHMCLNNRIELRTVHRYDLELKEKLECLLETGTLELDPKHCTSAIYDYNTSYEYDTSFDYDTIDDYDTIYDYDTSNDHLATNIYDYDTHLCFSHKTRIDINNKLMMNRKPETCLVLEANNKKKPASQKTYVYQGLPIVCIDNIKLNEIAFKNRQEFKVSSYSDESITIRETFIKPSTIDMQIGLEYGGFTLAELVDDMAVLTRDYTITHELFMINFRPSYCVNVHVAQSCTMDGAIVIHELSRFDKNMAYTALSRATKLSNILVSGNQYMFKFRSIVWENNRISNEAPDLQKDFRGYIYHLIRDDKPFYVGQTVNIERRRQEHVITHGTDFIIKSVRIVFRSEDILKIESAEIAKQIKLGYKLLNQTQLPIEEKPTVIKEGIVKPKTKLHGYFVDDKANYAYFFKYSVAGKKCAKKFSYKKCGLEAAKAKAIAFQKQMYQ